MKLLTIVGARPQFIKAAVLSKEIEKHPDIEEVLVHTGQHYDPNMSEIFFEQLKIPKPKYNLNINGGTNTEQTAKMLLGLQSVLDEEKPDYVLVYGDTNSTLAGGLIGAQMGIPVIHVEAGFRSHDRSMPEENNRVVTDHLSTLLFCPTKSTVEELKKEGLTKGVYFSGDIMYDATLIFSNEGDEAATMKKYGVEKNKYLYCTIHRASNTDDEKKLKGIFDALIESGENIILPLHPRTKKKLEAFGLLEGYQDKNITFAEPTDYLSSLHLTKNAKKVITDSGGILREAYFLKKSCLILRENVEFKEAVEGREAVLVGADKEKVIEAIREFTAKGLFAPTLGDGHACEEIINSIVSELDESR